MSKKNKGDTQEKLLLGRPSNNLKMGIVGLPNVGKSTLFNVLSKLQVAAMNYPFCTIDPNVARVAVPDERFNHLCGVFKPPSEVPTFLTITDIAGLVRGAHAGQGLGNAFLSHIGAVDGIYHVLRIFNNEEITHVEGAIDPVRDLEIIHEELRLKDIESMEKKFEALEKVALRVDKSKRPEVEFLQTKLLPFLKDGGDVRNGEWKNIEVEWLNDYYLLTAKPVIYLLNLSRKDFKRQKNKWLSKVVQWIQTHGGGQIIPFCGELEAELLAMSPEERTAYEEENKVKSQADKIITTGYHNLNLIHFFTCGPKEVRCWTVRKGTKAPDAAGVIHNDFRNGFICAEVMGYDDFVEHGNEAGVKAAGKYKKQGKTYVVQDGDIMFFKANTGAGLGKKKK